jgi:hypothetical protein
MLELLGLIFLFKILLISDLQYFFKKVIGFFIDILTKNQLSRKIKILYDILFFASIFYILIAIILF